MLRSLELAPSSVRSSSSSPRILVASVLSSLSLSPSSSRPPRQLSNKRTLGEGGGKILSKSETVKLVSAEGFEFIIDRKAAVVSNTLRNMLSSSGNFTGNRVGRSEFSGNQYTYSGEGVPVLLLVVAICQWKGDRVRYWA